MEVSWGFPGLGGAAVDRAAPTAAGRWEVVLHFDGDSKDGGGF